jgi:hypothetical protein
MTDIPRGIGAEVISLDIKPMRRKPAVETRTLPVGIKAKPPTPQPLWWRPGGANLLLAVMAKEPVERKPIMRRLWWVVFQLGLMIAALSCVPAAGYWALREFGKTIR